MSTSTETAVAVKKGRKWQVEVNGEPKGTLTTKKLAEAEANKFNGVVADKPAEKAAEPKADAAPAKLTPAEQATAKLDGKTPEQAAKEIAKWQGLLNDLREGGKSAEAKAVEEMVAVGDAWMAEHADDEDNPRAAAAKKAARARAEKAATKNADEAAKGAAAENSGTTATGRRAPRVSTIEKDGTQVCEPIGGGKCIVAPGKPQPVTKFPTISADKRGKECRACRNARLAAKKTA